MRPVGSKYLLEEVLGRGATGTVWRGQVRDTGDRVAIKVLKEELATDADVVMRFLRERSVLLRLSHPNIVRTRDLVVEGELLALVMDLVDSPDLHRYLRARGRFSPAAGALVMAQVADALAASHADGVVHRDLKPANILLEEATDAAGRPVMRPLLTDFGIARLADSPGVTRTSEFVGTPAYVAPESVEGRPQTSAVDIYGAGIVLYELVAGRPPFDGDGALAVLRQHLAADPPRPPGLPDPLWTVITACLGKDPSRRPSAVSLARALRVVADGVGMHANSAAITAAAGVAALLVPDPAPAPARAPGEPPAAGPDGQATAVLPSGTPGPPPMPGAPPPVPGAGDHTRVMPSGRGGGGPSEPEGPHPWQSQMHAARDRNAQTEVAYGPVQGQPPRSPRPQQQRPPARERQAPPPQQYPQTPQRQRPPARREARREARPEPQRSAPPAPPAPEPRRRERRPRQPMRIPGLGCLKGCLFIVVLLVVVAVLVWNLTPVPEWVAEGKSWYEAIRDAWDTGYDWVTTIGEASDAAGQGQ